MSGVLSVSNETLSEGAGASVNLAGSNDTLVMANGDYVGLLAGNDDTIDMNDGSVATLNFTTVSSILLNGSDDTVGAGTDVQVNVNGSNDSLFMANGDYVGLLAGNDDTVIINDGQVDGANNVTNVILSGSNDTVGAGSGTQLNVMGSNNELFMSNGDYVGLLTGDSGDTVIMNNGTIATLNTITNALIDGSNDVIGAGSAAQIYANGNGDTFSMSNGDYVGLYAGNSDVVNLNSGELQTAGNINNITLNGSNDQFITNINVTATLNGSNNGVGAASGNQIYVNGSGNTLYMSNGDYVGLYAGNGNVVNMNAGTLETLGDISNLVLNGSNDAIVVNVNVSIDVNGSGDNLLGFSGEAITLNGSADVVSAEEGSTVTLTSGDSGDTIDMIGGTIVVGTGVSNITINGTGDVISGPGSSLAGPITETVLSHVGPGGTVVFQTITNTPAVVYNAGDIADLVSYFEANPNLSQNQIQTAESDSNYDTNLAAYLNNANLSALPANVAAMLDGYSSIYLAIMGVPASALLEEDKIDQEFAWGSSNASVPSDSMSTMMQNLLPALMDTNTATEQDVSDALQCLANASANPTESNIIIMDTAAKLLFEMAEQPDNAKTGPLTEPYRVSLPGLSGPYEIAVQPTLPFGDSGTNEMVYIKNEDGGFWGEFWNDLDSYVVPIVDAAAILTGNFELVIAASALSAVQSGQAFAAGDDLAGILDALGAIGGGLDEFGSGTTQLFGATLEQAAATAQDIDGAIVAGQEGNILGILQGALGAISNTSTNAQVTQFAEIGSALAGTGSAIQSGDVLAAVDYLAEVAYDSNLDPENPYVVPQSLQQDIGALYSAYLATIYSEGGEVPGASTTGIVQVAGANNTATDASYVLPVSASQGVNAAGNLTITYVYPDGSKEIYTEGTLPWRSNNPGDITYGSFAVSQGAIGSDYSIAAGLTFAIFPSLTVGEQAATTLLSTSSTYQNSTINAAIATYTHDTGTLLTSYQSYVEGPSGLNLAGSTLMSTLSQSQISTMVSAIMVKEGFNGGAGTITNVPAP